MSHSSGIGRDDARIASIREALRQHSIDVLVCSLPLNVLLLSGYWPVVGTSVALASSDGSIHLIVPEDEEELARKGFASEITTFKPSSLDSLKTAADSLDQPLRKVAVKIGKATRVALETHETSAPASYAAMHLYGIGAEGLLQQSFPGASLLCANDILQQLRERKSPDELDRLRSACKIAERAFAEGAHQLVAGLTEVQAANLFRAALSNALPDFPQLDRADGFVFCMSGPNSATAHGAYARSRGRGLVNGDLVLVHCNSYADGFWTDITRTYHLGEPSSRAREMYAAVFAARTDALRTVAPGRTGATVDRAARNILEQRGFGPNFKHSTGHGVGFHAISPDARPRLHPKSHDTLQADMVCNLEPAVYLEGFGGIRHCDMIAVTPAGCELLTPFQGRLDDLVLAA